VNYWTRGYLNGHIACDRCSQCLKALPAGGSANWGQPVEETGWDVLSHSGGVIRAAQGLRVAERGVRVEQGDRDLAVDGPALVKVPESPAQEAFAANGEMWRRLWSLDDRMVIDFVDIAVVEVRDEDGSVTFDRALPADVKQHLLLDHVLPLVLARRGNVVLHGAVVGRGARSAVLVGPSGAGKSTLTAFAGSLGWTVGGDDGAVLTVGPPVLVEPTYRTIRLTQESMALLGIPMKGSVDVADGKRRLGHTGAAEYRQEPTELGVIAFLDPVPTGHPTRFTPLGGVAAHAELFGATFHADLAPGRRLSEVFDALAQVAGAVLVGRLEVPRGRAGLYAAERTLRRTLAAQTSE
jgi:hypothetical protein